MFVSNAIPSPWAWPIIQWASRALAQIESRGYHQKYAGQPVTLIGMEFSSVERNLVDCEWQRLP